MGREEGLNILHGIIKEKQDLPQQSLNHSDKWQTALGRQQKLSGFNRNIGIVERNLNAGS